MGMQQARSRAMAGCGASGDVPGRSEVAGATGAACKVTESEPWPAVSHLPMGRSAVGTPVDMAAEATAVVLAPSLRRLRGTAVRHGWSVAELSLEIFGRTLRRMGTTRGSPIIVLPSCSPTDGAALLQAATTGRCGRGHAMPLDMRLAISGMTVKEACSLGGRESIGFRHVRHWAGEESLIDPIRPKAGPGHWRYERVAVVLELSEWDDVLRIEGIRGAVEVLRWDLPGLVQAYKYELEFAAASQWDGA